MGRKFVGQEAGSTPDGDVTGPSSATANAIVLFNGTTGKAIKDSTYTVTAAGAALLDDANPAAQRGTLGLGSASTENTGTSGATVPLLNGNNTQSGVFTMGGKPFNAAKGAAVASAATADIWTPADGNLIHITGTTTITSLGTAPQAGAERVVIFDGALTLTHNASTLVLPGGANITTAANDMMVVTADTTTKMMVRYFPATGASVVSSAKNDILLYQDQATSGTTGPTYTAGGWRTVILDTEVIDTASIGSLSSNQVTLPAGSYEMYAVVSAAANTTSTNVMRARIRNVTDSTTVAQGVQKENTYASGSNIGAISTADGQTTIAGSKAFEVQLYPQSNTAATTALSSGDVEVYASLYIRRYA